MASQNRSYAFYSSKVLYYVILFISFVVAIKIFPWILDQLPQYISSYISYDWMYEWIAYAITFFSAIYLIPEVGFLLYKSLSEK